MELKFFINDYAFPIGRYNTFLEYISYTKNNAVLLEPIKHFNTALSDEIFRAGYLDDTIAYQAGSSYQCTTLTPYTKIIELYEELRQAWSFVQSRLDKIEFLLKYNVMYNPLIKEEITSFYDQAKKDAAYSRNILTKFIATHTARLGDLYEIYKMIRRYSAIGYNENNIPPEALADVLWYQMCSANIIEKLSEYNFQHNIRLDALNGHTSADYVNLMNNYIGGYTNEEPSITKLEVAVNKVLDKILSDTKLAMRGKINTIFAPCNFFQKSMMHLRKNYGKKLKRLGIYGAYIQEQHITKDARLAMDYAFIEQNIFDSDTVSIDDSCKPAVFGITVLAPNLAQNYSERIFNYDSLEYNLIDKMTQNNGIVICYYNAKASNAMPTNVIQSLTDDYRFLDDITLDEEGYEHLLVIAKGIKLDGTVYYSDEDEQMPDSKVCEQKELISLYFDTKSIEYMPPYDAVTEFHCRTYRRDLMSLVLLGHKKYNDNNIDCYDLDGIKANNLRGQIKSVVIRKIGRCLSPLPDKQFVSAICDEIFVEGHNDMEAKFDPFKIDACINDNMQPLLPFSDGQLGMVLASGVLDGVIEEQDTQDSTGNPYKHVIRGRIVPVTKWENETKEVGGNEISDRHQITSQAVALSVFDAEGHFRKLTV